MLARARHDLPYSHDSFSPGMPAYLLSSFTPRVNINGREGEAGNSVESDRLMAMSKQEAPAATLRECLSVAAGTGLFTIGAT